MPLIRKHFYFDPEQHAVLLAWLEKQPNQSQAIRRLIEAELDHPRGDNNSPPAQVDVEALRLVIREELARVKVYGDAGGQGAASGEDEEVTELMGDLLGNWKYDDED